MRGNACEHKCETTLKCVCLARLDRSATQLVDFWPAINDLTYT